MLIALILVSLLFVASLSMQLFGPKAAGAPPASTQARIDAEAKARQHAEAELEKKRKELEEQRASLSEVKEQLKQAKRKIFEQKGQGKEGEDLVKAREQVERAASLQLESTRAELSTAHAELQKLRVELEGNRRRPAAVAPSPAPAAAPVAPAPAPAPVQRVIRELSEVEKEKIQRLELQSGKDRTRAAELERELKRVKARSDTQGRMQGTTRTELELTKDKFKALEKRLNRTLLERDLLKRAITDLEKKSGVAAERTELSADELAASDQKVEDRQRAEAQAQAELQARLAAEAEPAPAEPAALSEAESVPTPPGLNDR